MQNITITTTQNTQLSITTTTTRNQFVKIAFPMQCAAIRTLAAKPNGLCGMSGENTALAVWANQLTNVDALTGLLPSVAKETMRLMSLRTLKKELAYLECKGDAKSQSRALAVGTVLSAGLREKLRQISLLYLRADTKGYEPEDLAYLLQACEKLVIDKYASFSIEELQAAFAHAATDANVKAYGVLNVQLLGEVLSMYKIHRDKALNAVLDQVKSDAQNIAFLEQIADKSDAAYSLAMQEFKALQDKNKLHKSFHTCPHHYVLRFIENEVIKTTQEEKAALLAEAWAHLAHDLLSDTPRNKKGAKDSLMKFLNSKGITPAPSHRAIDSDIIKVHLNNAFDYFNPADDFAKSAKMYLLKKLYFCNIQIFE